MLDAFMYFLKKKTKKLLQPDSDVDGMVPILGTRPEGDEGGELLVHGHTGVGAVN